MTQVRLDKNLLQRKEENSQNGSVKVSPSVNGLKSIIANDQGLTKLYVDVHEPKEIVAMLRDKGIYVEVKALPWGDYCWSNIGVERKTLADFYNSITHGDKHIWKQVFNLKKTFERPVLIIERWDDSFFTHRRIEQSVRGAIASIFLMGISILAIPGRGQNIQPFVDQLAYLFYSSDKKALSMRPVSDKRKLGKKSDYISDVITMIPHLGRRSADAIAVRINSIEELCKMSDEELKKLCPGMRSDGMETLRWILNGKELKKRKNP